MTNSNRTKEFIIGAAIGGVLGTVTALLVAPKAGKKLREDICDTCCSVAETTHDMADTVTKKSKCLAEGVSCCTEDFADKAKCFVDEIKHWFGGKVEEDEEEHSVKDLALGSLAGGVLGAAIGLLLAPKSGEDLREDIRDKYDDVADTAERFTKKSQKIAKKIGAQTTDWFNIAETVLNQFTDRVKEKGDDLIERGREVVDQDPVKKILNWATLGMKVWRGMNKRR